MPRSVSWKGASIYRPGAYTFHDLAGLRNLDLGAAAALIVVGEAAAGEPQASAALPVVHEYTNPMDMISAFQTGNLAEVARCAFGPALSGQNEDGISIKGVDVVYAIKTNQSAQASFVVQDGSAHNALTLKDKIWGLLGNGTNFTITTSGTGLILAFSRESAPLAGSQVSPVLVDTTVDFWFTIVTTAAHTGTTCTMAIGATTITLDSQVAGEDIVITTTGKTIAAICAEINSFAPITTACYAATPVAKHKDKLATYLDLLTATSIKAVTVKPMGSAYDIVTWINANSGYVSATWTAGYRPKAYTLTPLAGGTLGVSSETYIKEALKTARKLDARHIVFAYNADIATGSTPIELESAVAWFEEHLDQCNPILGRHERQGFACAQSTTKADLWTELSVRNSEWCAVSANEVYLEGPTGAKQWLGAHCAATMGAAILAGSPIATPLTQKYIKAYDFRCTATDFDPEDNLSFIAGITNGLLFLEKAGLGIRFAKGISTYKTEDNDGRILLDVVAGRLRTTKVLRDYIETPVVGHKGRGIATANQMRGRVIDAFQALADTNDPNFVLVAGTDDLGNPVAPYRNVVVRLDGAAVFVYAEVTYTQGIDWVFTDIRATLPSALAA